MKRVFVKERENAIVNRLNRTKREEVVDHEAVRQERARAQGRIKKAAATEARNQQLAAQRAYAADRDARDYGKRECICTNWAQQRFSRLTPASDAVLLLSPVFSDEAMAEALEEKERKAKLKALRQADGEDVGEESDDSFM